MKSYYYYKVIRKTIIQFLDIFNNIQIGRYSDAAGAADGVVLEGLYVVPLKFGPKQKTWYWINQRKDDEMLPIISVTLQGVEYASERQVSKSGYICKSKNIDAGTLQKFLNPIPYNFNFQVTIWSLHMVDVDQILEQILPFFTPYIQIRIAIPELSTTLDERVQFNGATPDITFDMSDEERRVLMWNLDFQVQGYLFQPLLPQDGDTSGFKIIKEMIIQYYTKCGLFLDRSSQTEFMSAAPSGGLYTSWTKGITALPDPDAALLYKYELFEEHLE